MSKVMSIKLKPGKYSLSREGDGAGDSGPRLMSLTDPDKKDFHYDELIRVGENGEIHVGCRIECGSINGRTYSEQDFWLTTPVTEILEVSEDKDYVKFKTGNSTYIVKSL